MDLKNPNASWVDAYMPDIPPQQSQIHADMKYIFASGLYISFSAKKQVSGLQFIYITRKQSQF